MTLTPGLSYRQAELIHAVCAGHTSRAMLAVELGVTSETVKTMLGGIYRKTGTSSLLDLVRRFYSLFAEMEG